MTGSQVSAEAQTRRELAMVRDIIGTANAGGGEVLWDHPEPVDVEALGALVADHVGGLRVEIGEPIIEPDQGHVRLPIDAWATPPLVVSRNSEAGAGRTGISLRKGEVYVRHGRQIRHANRTDFRSWTDGAVAAESDRWRARLTLLTDIPAGSQIRVLPATGEAFDEPSVLLDRALTLWRANRSRLLNGNELVVLFLARGILPADDEITELLVASALRRRPTLWFWLAERKPTAAALQKIFDDLIVGGDRDKTDAGRSLVEVAAMYETASDFNERMAELQRSRYRHFQQAAENTNRIDVLDRLAAGRETTVRKRKLSAFGTVELVDLAQQLASELRSKPSSSRSRQLTMVGLELFARDLEASERASE